MNLYTKPADFRIGVIITLFLFSFTPEAEAQEGYSDLSGIAQTNGVGPVNVSSISCGPISDISVDYSATAGNGGSTLFEGGAWTDGLKPAYSDLAHTMANPNEVPRVYTEVQNGGTSTITFDFSGAEDNFELVIYDLDYEDTVEISAVDALGSPITDCSGWTVNGTGDMTTWDPNGQGTAPTPTWNGSTCTSESSDNANYHRSFLSLTPDQAIQEVTMDLSSSALNGMHVYYTLYCNAALLPVELVSFSSETSGDSAHLLWSTASESNNAGFEVEYAKLGQDFSSAGFVAGQGTTTLSSDYEFEFNSSESGLYRFRLKQIDFDGSFEYSAEIEEFVGIAGRVFLTESYPNPVNGQLQTSIKVATGQEIVSSLYSIDGREVSTLFAGYLAANQVKNLSLDTSNLPVGNYIVSVQGESDSQQKLISVLR